MTKYSGIKFIFVFAMCYSMAYAGAVCDYKIDKAREGVRSYQAYKNSKKFDENKLKEVKSQLDSLLKSCDDEAVLKEMEEYIAKTKKRYEIAKQNLAILDSSKNPHQITQAKLEYKIAHIEYIAARQEELRLKDLQKSNR